MKCEKDLRCVVSGSFLKFKPEIDLAIDELSNLGVVVLAPEKGWLLKPSSTIVTPKGEFFRPLQSEQGMTPKQVEDSFLKALSLSDFVYVVNPDGYVGNMVSMEIGFAMARGIPVYSQRLISPKLDEDPLWNERISQIQTLTIFEVIKDLLKKEAE